MIGIMVTSQVEVALINTCLPLVLRRVHTIEATEIREDSDRCPLRQSCVSWISLPSKKRVLPSRVRDGGMLNS